MRVIVSIAEQGLRLLDIGCGGGLLSEPMTRLGASVTGVDASAAIVWDTRTGWLWVGGSVRGGGGR